MSFDISKISDPRIGYRTKEGQILKKPIQYANGVSSEGLGYVPTTVFFGPDRCFFYYLPILVGAAPEKLRAELEAIVTGYVGEPAKEKKSKQKPVEEVTIIENVEDKAEE